MCMETSSTFRNPIWYENGMANSCPHASQGTLGDCDSGARLSLISFTVSTVLAGRLR